MEIDDILCDRAQMFDKRLAFLVFSPEQPEKEGGIRRSGLEKKRLACGKTTKGIGALSLEFLPRFDSPISLCLRQR